MPASDCSVQAMAARFYSISEGAVDSARQDYIDALPVAVAVLCQDRNGRTYVDIANDIFRGTAAWDEAKDGSSIEAIGFFTESGIGRAVADFLGGGETACQFEGQDGQAISGRHYTVRLATLQPAPYAPQRCLISLIDKTVQVETEKNLRAEMLRDSLSGLPNRLAFNERIDALLAAGAGEGIYAVLVVDMARFSRVNESVGALAGDELIITFARRLCSALRPGDVLARTGGDEFAILLRLTRGTAGALEFAERIKIVLSTPFHLSDLEIRVDCAIGCVLVTGREGAAEEILRNAQFALKRSKGSGGIEFYEPGQAQAARRRFRIETELRRALDAGQLELALQPLVDLSTGAVAGFEALTRWEHGEGEAIAPSEFIAVAEESGLIVPLGRWSLHAALSALSQWDQRVGRPLPLYVAVNLSAVQIQRDDIETMVAEALEQHGIDGSRLMLELTESAIVHDPERASEVLHAMKRLNVRIAIDDFGTGYTSLAYLQRLPIDMLKIDASFVTNMLDDADSTSIVRAVLSLAASLGLSTTAEGIEQDELVPALRNLGCKKGQGYLFSAPLDAAAAYSYWASRSA